MSLYGLIAVHLAVALVFYGSLRARLPIEPVIAMFASAGLVRLAALVRRTGPGGSGAREGG
jgi:hypothetical protein